jgi:hypothetical protein
MPIPSLQMTVLYQPAPILPHLWLRGLLSSLASTTFGCINTEFCASIVLFQSVLLRCFQILRKIQANSAASSRELLWYLENSICCRIWIIPGNRNSLRKSRHARYILTIGAIKENMITIIIVYGAKNTVGGKLTPFSCSQNRVGMHSLLICKTRFLVFRGVLIFQIKFNEPSILKWVVSTAISTPYLNSRFFSTRQNAS